MAKEALSKLRNPTQVKGVFQKSVIPRTAVRGFFRSFLPQAPAKQLGIPRTAVRGFFRSFLPQALIGRKDLNLPPTAVGGIPGNLISRVERI